MYTENVELSLNSKLVVWPDSFIFDLTRKLSTSILLAHKQWNWVDYIIPCKFVPRVSHLPAFLERERRDPQNGCVPCTWAEL